MDNNLTLTLVIINLLLNFLQVVDHFLNRVKRSRCWGSEIELYRDNKQEAGDGEANPHAGFKQISSAYTPNQNINKINFDELIKAFKDLRKDDSDYNDEEKNKTNK